MNILVTGSAGFIGFHIAKKLIEEGHNIIGLDAITNYYETSLKINRNNILKKSPNYEFIKGKLENKSLIENIFTEYRPVKVLHLGGQAGVRHSLENPKSYVESNIVGTFNILEACKNFKVEHLIYASTSSIYGLNNNLPFKENDKADKQISVYSSTKKSAESLCHAYSYLFNIPISVLRFFTVYGPYGRPDMALFKFTKAILDGDEIELYNNGKMRRDFTYIDDVVTSIFLLVNNFKDLKNINEPKKNPYRVVNIGSSQKITLLEFLETLERILGKKARFKHMPMQPGDMLETFSDSSYLNELTGFKPSTKLEQGISSFVDWYKGYYKIN